MSIRDTLHLEELRKQTKILEAILDAVKPKPKRAPAKKEG